MTSTTQRQSDLLRVARDHFADRGYQGTSLAQISAELGVTKQALLHHFKSKDQLYRSVLTQVTQELLQLLFAAMEDETETAEQQLERFFAALSGYLVEHRAAAGLVIAALTDGPGLKALAQDAKAPLQDFLEPLVALVQATDRWQGQGFAAALTAGVELLGAICLMTAAQCSLAQRFGRDVADQSSSQASAHLPDLVAALLRGQT